MTTSFSGSVQVQTTPGVPVRKFSPPSNSYLGQVSQQVAQTNGHTITKERVASEKISMINDIFAIMKGYLDEELESNERIEAKMKFKKSKKKGKNSGWYASSKDTKAFKRFIDKYDRMQGFRDFGQELSNENGRTMRLGMIRIDSLQKRYNLGVDSQKLFGARSATELVELKVKSLGPKALHIYNSLLKRAANELTKSWSTIRFFIDTVEENLRTDGKDIHKSIYLRKSCFDATCALVEEGFESVPSEWWN